MWLSPPQTQNQGSESLCAHGSAQKSHPMTAPTTGVSPPQGPVSPPPVTPSPCVSTPGPPCHPLPRCVPTPGAPCHPLVRCHPECVPTPAAPCHLLPECVPTPMAPVSPYPRCLHPSRPHITPTQACPHPLCASAPGVSRSFSAQGRGLPRSWVPSTSACLPGACQEWMVPRRVNRYGDFRLPTFVSACPATTEVPSAHCRQRYWSLVQGHGLMLRPALGKGRGRCWANICNDF